MGRKDNYNKNAQFSKITGIRSYHLSDEDLSILIEKRKLTGIFQNPYRKNGIYFAVIQALINIGQNKQHTFMQLKKQIMNVMKGIVHEDGFSSWDKFINKSSSNGKSQSQWDANTRIQATLKILQRLGGKNPDGYKLRQLCACLDLMPSTDSMLKSKPNVRLNTSFATFDAVKPIKVPHRSKGRKRKLATATV